VPLTGRAGSNPASDTATQRFSGSVPLRFRGNPESPSARCPPVARDTLRALTDDTGTTRPSLRKLWSSKAVTRAWRIGFGIGVGLVVVDWIDYLWVCKTDCGNLGTAIAATVFAPLFVGWLCAAVIMLWRVWRAILTPYVEAFRSRREKPAGGVRAEG
jgi:hypothetical protein